MSAGIDHATGDHVVLMHADLQDPPELIPEMLEATREGRGCRVCAAHRARRELAQAHDGDELLPADGAPRAHALPGAGGRLPAHVAPCRRRAAPHARAAALPARDGRVGRLRAGADRVPPRRAPARAAARPTASSSGSPPRRWRRSPTCRWRSPRWRARSSPRSRRSARWGSPIATAFGWVTASIEVWTLVVILFLGGVQLISVGILGRYLARVHEQTLGRPLYVVSRVVRSGGGSSAASADAPAARTTQPPSPR